MVDFNPYREWLGVESASDRPNHYELLGLPPFESDADRIVHAADRRLNQVRKIRPGSHIEHWQHVLDELTEIRRLLTDVARKQQYDDQLRRQQGLGGGLSAAIVPANPTKQDSDVQVSPVRNLLPPSAEDLARDSAGNAVPNSGGGKGTSGVAASGSGPSHGTAGPAGQNAPAGNGYGNVPYGTGFGPVIPDSYGQGAGGPPASAFPSPPSTGGGGQGQGQPPHHYQSYQNQPHQNQPNQQGQPGQQPPYVQPQPNYGQGQGPYGQGQASYGQAQGPYGQGQAPNGQGQFAYGAGQPTPYPQGPFGQGQFGQGQFGQGQYGQGQYGQGQPGQMGQPGQFGQGQPGYGGPPQMPWGGQAAAPNALAGGWGGANPPAHGPQGGMPPAGMPPAGAPMALPLGRSVPSGNPMTPPPGATPSYGAPPSSTFGSAESGAADVDEPAPSVSATSSSAGAILAGRRRSSQATLIVGIGGAIIGVAALALVMQLMNGDRTSTANPESEKSAAEAAKNPLGVAAGDGAKPATVPAAAIDEPNGQPKPEVAKPDVAPPVAPMPMDEPDAPDAMPDEPNETEPATPDVKPDESDPPVVVQPKPRPPAPIDDPRPDAPDTSEAAIAEMTKALADAKAALVARNVVNAKTQLTVAASMANAPDHKAMVKRLETLTHFVGEFWKGVGDGLKGLDGVDELLVGELRVSVVEHSDDDLTIRAGGKNLHYTIDDLPSGLAEVLFERVREMKDPLNQMSKGAFHAVDDKRTADSARRIFQAAQLSGGDVAELMAVLDDKYDVKNPPVARAVPQKRHLPDPSAMTEATGAVKAKYGKEISAARTPQQKYDLAKKIMEEAALPMDNEATRLALFNESRDLAANAHLAQLTVQIIDETEKWFEIDVLATKFDALSKAAVRASPQAARDIALECLQLTDQAEEAKRLDMADKFIRVAAGMARASRDTDLAKRATERMKDVQKAFREAAAQPPGEKPTDGGGDQDAAAKPADEAKA